MYEDVNYSMVEEKSYTGLKLAVIFILFAFITIIIGFIFLVSKVNADTFDTPKYIILNSPSYPSVSNLTCYGDVCPDDLTGNGQRYQQANFYWDYQFEAGKTYEYQILAQVITPTQITPNSNNIGYVFRFITPGVVNASCDSDCEVNYFYRGTTSYYLTGGVSLPTKMAVFIYEVAISGKITVTQNFQSFGINVNIGNIVLGTPYSYAVITDTSTETDKIIDNDNKNTDKIIRNNDKNTDRIVDSNGNTQYTITQNTEAINDLTDTINNPNVSSDTGSSFFSSFQDNHHGLSGIITAPLVAINTLLEGDSCIDMSATYRDETFAFPCGRILWGKSNVAPLKTFLNLTFGGLLCYAIIRKLFLKVQELKNPEDDRIEVMDL